MPESGQADPKSHVYNRSVNVSMYSRNEGLLVLPLMGPPGTPPKVIRVHAPIGERHVRWAYSKRGSPPIMPSMGNTESGDIFLGGNLSLATPSIGGADNQYDYAASGEYSYLQGTLRSASYNVRDDDPHTIADATNATPIVITSEDYHALGNGDRVSITGVGGNTAANGVWVVTYVSGTEFSLNGSVGSGSYTSGGTWRTQGLNQPSEEGKFQTGRQPYRCSLLNATILALGGTEAGQSGWVEPPTSMSARANSINFNDPEYKYYDTVVSSLFFSSDLII